MNFIPPQKERHPKAAVGYTYTILPAPDDYKQLLSEESCRNSPSFDRATRAHELYACQVLSNEREKYCHYFSAQAWYFHQGRI